MPKMPPRELIAQVCEAGTWAPTGHGKQSPLIVAITRRDIRDRLSALNARIWNELTVQRGGVAREGIDPFYGAPVILLVLADHTVPTHLYDGCAVLTNMANMAESLGLATCWIHRAHEETECTEGRQLLAEMGISGDYVGIDHLALGYAAGPAPVPRPRKEGYVRWVE